MTRLTIRLTDHELRILEVIAQELTTNKSGAFRSVLANAERTRKLQQTIEDAKDEILRSISAFRNATIENFKRTAQHFSQHHE